MKYIVSISKTYIHRGNHWHRSKTKKRWHIYYYDEEGNFRTKKVNWLQAMYYKTRKLRRIKYVCTDCGSQFIGFVRSRKARIECPNCEAN